MAIAYDNSAVGGDSNSGDFTMSYTVTGSNPTLLLWVVNNNSSGTVSGATYNGVSMTNIADVHLNTNFQKAFMLQNPATGSNTLVVNRSSGANISVAVASYTGTDTTGSIPSASQTQTFSGTSFAETLSSVANNSWHVALEFSYSTARNLLAGTATTLRTEATTGGVANRAGIFDNNAAITPAGSNTITETSILSNAPEVWDVMLAPFASSPSSSVSSSPSSSASSSPSSSASHSPSSSPSPSSSVSSSPSSSASSSPSPSSSVSSSISHSPSSSPSPSSSISSSTSSSPSPSSSVSLSPSSSLSTSPSSSPSSSASPSSSVSSSPSSSLSPSSSPSPDYSVATRDENFVPVLLAVSSADGVTPIEVFGNPFTGSMLISS